ncbi:MAG: DUF4129 domain-containing protein [Candidatus Dormibacteria bacterium]
MAAAVALLGTQLSTTAVADGCAAGAYVNRLHQSLAALQQVPPDPVRARGLIAPSLATDGPAVLTPVLAALDSRPPDISDARRRLAALTAVLDLPPRSGCQLDAGPARDALRHVYASRVFATLDAAEHHSLLEDAGDALFRALTGLAGWVHPGVLVGLSGVLACALAGYGVWAWRRLPAAIPHRSAERPAGARPNPDAEWGAAISCAAAGDHRQAVRRAFRSALLSVMVRGRLPVDPSWTTGQLLAHAAADADLVAALAPAAASFDHAWYSRERVTADDWDRARSQCQVVRSLAGRRRSAPVT